MFGFLLFAEACERDCRHQGRPEIGRVHETQSPRICVIERLLAKGINPQGTENGLPDEGVDSDRLSCDGRTSGSSSIETRAPQSARVLFSAVPLDATPTRFFRRSTRTLATAS